MQMQISHPLAPARFILAIALSRIPKGERDSALCPMRVCSAGPGAAKWASGRKWRRRSIGRV